MIGVLSKDSETRAVEEFFQLFKTPWEFWAPHKNYDLVIATRKEIPRDVNANVLVIYNSDAISFDDRIGVVTNRLKNADGLNGRVSSFRCTEISWSFSRMGHH